MITKYYKEISTNKIILNKKNTCLNVSVCLGKRLIPQRIEHWFLFYIYPICFKSSSDGTIPLCTLAALNGHSWLKRRVCGL